MSWFSKGVKKTLANPVQTALSIASPLTAGIPLLAKNSMPTPPGAPDQLTPPDIAAPPTPGLDPNPQQTDLFRRQRLLSLRRGIFSTILSRVSPLEGQPSTMPVLKDKVGL